MTPWYLPGSDIWKTCTSLFWAAGAVSCKCVLRVCPQHNNGRALVFGCHESEDIPGQGRCVVTHQGGMCPAAGLFLSWLFCFVLKQCPWGHLREQEKDRLRKLLEASGNSFSQGSGCLEVSPMCSRSQSPCRLPGQALLCSPAQVHEQAQAAEDSREGSTWDEPAPHWPCTVPCRLAVW